MAVYEIIFATDEPDSARAKRVSAKKWRYNKMIIPSIDLMDGNAVQLVQGNPDNKKIELDDVKGLAFRFSQIGPINVIDLDAALGRGNNKDIVKDLAKENEIRVGGGVREISVAQEYVDAGVKKVIIGSRAFQNGGIDKEFLNELKETIGKDKIIIAIDSKAGKVVIKGWTESTGLDAKEIVKELEEYCSEFLYTYVDKEGMMQGTDIETLKELKELTDNEITAAGGISSIEEIKQLEEIGVNSVLGMALYTGKIKYEELLELSKK
ncbi:HisA/HisF-related TIM barrel protein [Nanoarchaeota archaeon]